MRTLLLSLSDIQGHKKIASWTAFAVTDSFPLKPVMVLSEGTEGTGVSSFAKGPQVPVYYLGQMPGKGVSDGFKIDNQGLIWSSMPGGICILDPKPPRPHVVAKACGAALQRLQFACSLLQLEKLCSPIYGCTQFPGYHVPRRVGRRRNAHARTWGNIER